MTVEIHGVARDVASRQTAVVTNNGACWLWAGPATAVVSMLLT